MNLSLRAQRGNLVARAGAQLRKSNPENPPNPVNHGADDLMIKSPPCGIIIRALRYH